MATVPFLVFVLKLAGLDYTAAVSHAHSRWLLEFTC